MDKPAEEREVVSVQLSESLSALPRVHVRCVLPADGARRGVLRPNNAPWGRAWANRGVYVGPYHLEHHVPPKV